MPDGSSLEIKFLISSYTPHHISGEFLYLAAIAAIEDADTFTRKEG